MSHPEVFEDSSETLSALRRFARARANVERCELCSAVLTDDHQHLLDKKSRHIACACDACSILFCDQQGGKFLRIPRRIRRLNDFVFDDLEWEAMMIPINLAFFLRDAHRRLIAMYPSPAGAIESQIDLTIYNDLPSDKTRFPELEPEVEALLVNRISEQHAAFVVPVDECYRLVGIVKTKWRGLSGGLDVWAAIHQFFVDLDARAIGKASVTHA